MASAILDEITGLLEDLAVPFRALVVAGLGVLLARLWFTAQFLIVVLISLCIIVLGVVLYAAGRSQLPRHPVRGLALMEFYVISPAMFAAVAAGAIIVVTVEWSAPEGTAAETKELLTALTTAITAFLTSGFISWTEDQDDSSLANRIKTVFESKYKRFDPDQPAEKGVKYFRTESAGERWVYSDEFKGVEGWGGKARRKRAKGLALEIKTGGSDPPR